MKPLRVVASSIAVSMLLVSGGHAERVGPTDIWVENTRPVAYRIEGGTTEYFARGTCEVQFDGQPAIGIVAGRGTCRLKPVAGACRE